MENNRYKFFVVSDIHSFYSELKAALDKAGFDENNERHILVSVGDAFDRGDESIEMLHFLMGLERKILVRGNHDTLLEDCCKRGYAQGHDFGNGTAKTIYDIGEGGAGNSFETCCELTYTKTEAYRDSLVNYFETKNYIFVHGWIPCEEYEVENKPWWQTGKVYRYNPDWRSCNDVEWESAQWICSYKVWKQGIKEPNKTIVCGHWHTSVAHSIESCGEISEWGDDACFDPFYSDGIIMIDGCIAHTGKCNVLVLEDEFLEGLEDANE